MYGAQWPPKTKELVAQAQNWWPFYSVLTQEDLVILAQDWVCCGQRVLPSLTHTDLNHDSLSSEPSLASRLQCMGTITGFLKFGFAKIPLLF